MTLTEHQFMAAAPGAAGQVPRRDLYDDLVATGVSVHLIGGADVALELDAKRAIAQGTALAAAL